MCLISALKGQGANILVLLLLEYLMYYQGIGEDVHTGDDNNGVW